MQVVTIPYAADNYSYLLICEQTGEAAVVDPGESEPVVAAAKRYGVDISTAFLTHHHGDHIGGTGGIRREWKGVEICCHISDKERISDATHLVKDGSSVSFGNCVGQVLHTPGHTRGSICYFFGGMLFTGDTLFGAGCGRLFEGEPREMLASLNKIAEGFAEDTRIFFGHEYTETNLRFAAEVDPHNQRVALRLQELREGNGVSTPTDLALEKETNPFLRSEKKALLAGIEGKRGKGVSCGLELFTVLRQLRNSY